MPLTEEQMDRLRDRVARILYEQFQIVTFPGNPVPWRDPPWSETASAVIKEVIEVSRHD